jgi:hypothetical protein
MRFDGSGLVVSEDAEAWYPLNDRSTRWTSQAAWFVDPTNGDDTADGSQGSPIRTLSEYFRRIGRARILQPTTVTILGDITEGTIVVRGDFREFLTIIGTPTTIGGGNFTAVQVYNEATGVLDDGQVTDAGIIGGWTAAGFLGKRLLLTDGPDVGSWGWCLIDLGGNTCRYGPFFDINTFTAPDPAVLGAYSVQQLTQLNANLVIEASADTVIVFQDVEFAPAAGQSIRLMSGELDFYGCKIGGGGVRVGGASYGAHFFGCFIALSSSTVQLEGGQVNIYSTSWASALNTTGPGVRVHVNLDSVMQPGAGGIPVVNIAFNVGLGGRIEIASAGWLAAFDEAGANPVMRVQPGGQAWVKGKLWGTNWGGGGGNWIIVDSRGGWHYTSPNTMAIHAEFTGVVVAEVAYGSLTSTIAAVGAAGVTSPELAAVVPAFT